MSHVELKPTNGVKAVDVEAGWTLLSYMDLLQAVVRVVGQYDLNGHHTGLVQTGLPCELVLGWQTFSRHVVKQLVGRHGPERRNGHLKGERHQLKKPQGLVLNGHFRIMSEARTWLISERRRKMRKTDSLDAPRATLCFTVQIHPHTRRERSDNDPSLPDVQLGSRMQLPWMTTCLSLAL